MYCRTQYVTFLCSWLATCLAFPTDLDIRGILDRLYTSTSQEILIEDPNWQVDVGQVGGLAIAPNKDVVVFHRGERRWTGRSFNFDNTYAQKERGPVKAETIVRFDPNTGKRSQSLGANKFYMPHGLTIDGAGNMWLTDVALHQVFRIPKGETEPDLELGTAFVPGKTNNTFCKPTDVAVASNGDFFVSDGYCNGRIMKFSKDKSLLAEWGHKATDGTLGTDTLFVPHSLALSEEHDLICVADRENKRVLCYNAGLNDASKTGVFDRYLVTYNQIGRVFGIDYDPVSKVMYAVVTPDENQLGARGFTIDMTGKILDSWGVADMGSHSQPHDVAVSLNGNDIYVGDVGDVRSSVTHFRKEKQIYVG